MSGEKFWRAEKFLAGRIFNLRPTTSPFRFRTKNPPAPPALTARPAAPRPLPTASPTYGRPPGHFRAPPARLLLPVISASSVPDFWSSTFALSDLDALDHALHVELPAGADRDVLGRLCAYAEERAALAEAVRDAREDGYSVDAFMTELAKFDAGPRVPPEQWPRAHCFRLVEEWLKRLRIVARVKPDSAGARSLDTYVTSRGNLSDAFPGVLRVRVPLPPPTADELYPTCAGADDYGITASGRVERSPPPRLGAAKPVLKPKKRVKRALTPVPSPVEFVDEGAGAGADPAAQRGPRGASESQHEHKAAKGTARGYCLTAHIGKPGVRTEPELCAYVAAVLERVAAGYERGEFRAGSGQLELCPTTGSIHWQLAFLFHDPVRMTGCLKTLAPYFQDEREGAAVVKPHAEAMRRTPAEARGYCLKPETRFVIPGMLASFDHGAAVSKRSHGKGSRTDLQYAEAADVLIAGGERELAVSHPALMATNLEGIRLLAEARAPPVAIGLLDGLVPRNFQIELLALAREPADPRAVHFVLDPRGGSGKSSVAAQIHADNRDHSVLMSWDVSMRDTVMLFNRNTRVVLCNLPRGAPLARTFQRDWGNLLGSVEQIKDRVLMQQKYHSKNIILERSPHVIIFANELGRVAGLTLDRPIIWLLTEPAAEFSAAPLAFQAPPPYPPLYIPYRRRIFYGSLAGQRREAGEEY